MASANNKVPRTMQETYDAVVSLTDGFCREQLDDEYAQLCRAVAAALCRKRPSPLLSGKLQVWACGIIYAVGQINFLFDGDETPHYSRDQLCEAFGVAQSTASQKAKLIRDALRMEHFDPDWSRQSIIDRSPLTWLLELNGFVVDARQLPRDVQAAAYEMGLIPYIPADRDAQSEDAH